MDGLTAQVNFAWIMKRCVDDDVQDGVVHDFVGEGMSDGQNGWWRVWGGGPSD